MIKPCHTSLHWMLFVAVMFLFSCGKKENKPSAPVLFHALDDSRTGLHFSNKLEAKPNFNMLRYMYFYNGAGVGAGDFNNDGLTDLFFASNQAQNKLYLNKGDLHFEDVTAKAKIPEDGGWSTGVSVADVNDDGLLDIYVCRVGHYEQLQSKNQLLICKGIAKDGVPYYEDQAKQYGLDFSGFSTQAAFLDYDLDGDLDMFLLNHSLRYNSTFAPRSSYEGTADSLSGDIMYRNEGNRFTDVSGEAGINRSVIGYGLGIAISDINMDGYPDIYIGNDFHENDYLYINNKNGGFTDNLTNSMMHTSQFSMGVDVADINNDALPEIIAADMLPSDPYILKRSLGEDEYNTFQIKIKNGYNYQYARNTLQLNRGNGLFSEVGLYSGVYATDWSWASLWMDFDNDGWKDLFISNGIPKRLNDIDYINYVSNDEIQNKIRANEMGEKDMALIDKFPQIKLPNRFFRNKGDVSFEDAGTSVDNNSITYSNGAVYADFDNDGDLDIVVNNIDDPALLYQNTSNDNKEHPAVQLKLYGPKGNRHAVGSKVLVYSGIQISSYEKFPVRGFQSSMEIPLHIGLSKVVADSAILIWPDNTFQKISFSKDSIQQVAYQKGLPLFNYQHLFAPKDTVSFSDITSATGISFSHVENPFNEFDREPLIPFMSSREGPALATGDVNGDGLDDFFIGTSKGNKSAVFIQEKNGRFKRLSQPALDADSVYEDTDAVFADMNQDGYADLLVASGGNEYYGKSEYLLSRLYLNDGKGSFARKAGAFPLLYMNASCIVAADFTGDDLADVFIGGRSVPFDYGKMPVSYLFENDGTGKFTDVTAAYAPALSNAGMVKDAAWTDIDNDKDADLVLATEWGTIDAYINQNKKFNRQPITDNKGWWNFILPVDLDRDGDMDFIAGNQGRNSRLQVSKQQPVRLYYYDFDANGKKEQVLTYYLDGKELPFANKAELEKQMPYLKKKFLYAEDLAKASLHDIFNKSDLEKAQVLTADYFDNAILINDGGNKFRIISLPWQSQLTSYRDALATDINNDGLPDILPAGNFYANNIQMGRYDADYGSQLINRGNDSLSYSGMQGAIIKGEARHIRKIMIAGKECFLIARNDDSIIVIRKNQPIKK